MDLRPDVGVLVTRISLPERAGLCQEPLGEVVHDGLFYEQARAGETDLAGVVVLRDRGGHREVEVGVGEDQQWRLAAQLQ